MSENRFFKTSDADSTGGTNVSLSNLEMAAYSFRRKSNLRASFLNVTLFGSVLKYWLLKKWLDRRLKVVRGCLQCRYCSRY